MDLKFTSIVNQRKEIPKLVEKTSNSKGYVSYGDSDDYPNYLYELYENSSLFNAIVATMTDYVFGDGFETNATLPKYINRKWETIDDVVKKIVHSYIIFGGFAIQAIRNRNGEVCELNVCDFRKIRINEDEDTIYYGDFSSYSRKNKIISYPRFTPNSTYNNSIFYYKNPNSKGIYPTPTYIGAIKAIELSTQVTDFHLNQIVCGFSPQAVINLNSGICSQEEMEEIEAKFQEKFFGVNGSKIVLSFNNDTEHATSIERLADESYDTKYESLRQHTQDEILTSFRLNGILLGYNKTNSAFTQQEFEQAFKLYQKTVIAPIQQQLSRVLETLFNAEFKFKEFTIDWGDTNENGNIPTQGEENKLINIGDNN